MNFIQLAAEYIAIHARNIEADTVRHLKALALHFKSSASTDTAEIKADVEQEVKTVDTKVETEVKTVESAAKEIEQHSKTAFADLLAAQAKSKPTK